MRFLCLLTLMLLFGCATVSDEVVAPAAYAKTPTYSYPPISRRLMEQGTVLVRVLVLENGRAGEVQILKSSGYARLDAAAVANTKIADFVPAKTKSGRRVNSWIKIPIHFMLE